MRRAFGAPGAGEPEPRPRRQRAEDERGGEPQGRLRGVIAGLLALTVIALSAAGLAVRDAANASRQAANAARQHAIALSRQLTAESLAADPASPLTARRLAVAAWRIFPPTRPAPSWRAC